MPAFKLANWLITALSLIVISRVRAEINGADSAASGLMRPSGGGVGLVKFAATDPVLVTAEPLFSLNPRLINRAGNWAILPTIQGAVTKMVVTPKPCWLLKMFS